MRQPRTRDERARINRAVKQLEEAALWRWAEENGRLIDGEDFARRWREFDPTGDEISGGEHKVYRDPATTRWWKANDGAMHGTWCEYFERLALHGWLYPETAYWFHGFTNIDDEFHAVVSQPDITADRGATPDEVAPQMTALGFRGLSGRTDDYYHSDLGIIVQDLHGENALVAPDGRTIIMLDPIPYVPDILDFEKGGMLAGEPLPVATRGLKLYDHPSSG